MTTWAEIIRFVEDSRSDIVRELLDKCAKELIKQSCDDQDRLNDERCRGDMLQLEVQQLKEKFRAYDFDPNEK